MESKQQKGTVANMLKNRLKKLLIISITAVILYGCYSLYVQICGESSARYAQIVVESPFKNVQRDTDFLNKYFQEKVIVVKRKSYRDGELLWETEYNRAGEEIKKVRYKSDGSIDEWVEYECGADGKTSEKIWYHGNGKLSSRTVFKYDEAGNLIESTQYDYDGIITYKSTYAYDEAGNEIERVEYNGNNIYRRYEYEYDESGKWKKFVEYNSQGDIFSYGEYEYDEAGHAIKDEYHDIAEGIEHYYTYQYRYNETGDIEKEICYVEDGSIGYWHEYKYDEEGHRLSELTYGSDGIYRRIEHKYDKNGKEIKRTWIEDGEVTSQSEYCRDEWGNVTEERSSREGSPVYTYEYEYEFVYTKNAKTKQNVEKEEEVTALDKETPKEQAVLAYRKFIDGRCSAGGVNIYELAMPTGEPDRRYPTDYAIIDVNGDGMPELNIRTARELTVISFEDGELRVFKYIEPGSVWSVSLLNNGAFMYFSDRFSACSYSYFELDESGNKINGLGFYWDENDGNYIPDEFDDFFFDDNACSMEEWYDKTREYLYTDENGREQIRNQVEWTRYCEADPVETNGQVLYEGRREYQLTLYDKEQNELLSEFYPESMWIDGVSEDVLEIGISVGNPANYTYYFNKETAQISDTFCNAIVVGDKYIAYMEDDASDREERTLILSDIFKEGILYQEITRDFSKTAEPMSAIISIEMIDDENIRLEYYQGEDYTIEYENISIQPELVSYRIQDKHITQDIKDTEIQLNICCPQIIYPDAQDIAAKINQSIEERIMKECVVEHSTYDFDYEVKYRGEECFSILFWGMRSGSGAYPNDIAVGLTYDMTTGRLLHITDIIEKDKLQQKLEQKNFEQQRGIKVYYYEKDVAQEEVNWFDTYWLNQYVSEKSSYEEGEHKTDFYLTSDKIGILYEVGHSFGDYIVLEIERMIGTQSNEELPEVYYRILNQGMAVEGEGREYIKEEITFDEEKDVYYEEYQSYLKYYNVSYEEDDDRSKMRHNGTYYFIDGEMVSGEDVETWLEEKVWQQMIPAEEWGIVP